MSTASSNLKSALSSELTFDNSQPFAKLFTKKAPYSNFCQNCPKSWRNFITISEKNSRAKLWFTSFYQIYKERNKHLISKYWYIIHPFSILNKYIQIFSLFVWVVAFHFELFHIAMVERGNELSHGNLLLIILHICCFVLMILSFFTGYFDSKTHKVILTHKKIAKHYVKTWFIIDLVPILVFVEYTLNQWYKFHEMNLYFKLINFLRYLRVIRVITIIDYLGWITSAMNIRQNCHVIIRTTLFAALVLHFMSCTYICIPYIFYDIYPERKNLSWVYQLEKYFERKLNRKLTSNWLYLHSFRENLLKLDPTGVLNTITPINMEDLVLSLIFVLMGYALQIYIVVTLYYALQHSYQTSLQYQKNLSCLEAYCFNKQISQKLTTKLHRSFQKFYRGHSFNETFDVSNELNYEILLGM